jgi:hypothetical protein
MPTNITWKLELVVPSGPQVSYANAVEVDAVDRIAVSIPDTTAAPAATTVEVQPGAAGKVKMLLIRASTYGTKVEYQVHDAGAPKRVLSDALFLIDSAPIDLLGTPLDKLLITNTSGKAVDVEVLVGRAAV